MTRSAAPARPVHSVPAWLPFAGSLAGAALLAWLGSRNLRGRLDSWLDVFGFVLFDGLAVLLTFYAAIFLLHIAFPPVKPLTWKWLFRCAAGIAWFAPLFIVIADRSWWAGPCAAAAAASLAIAAYRRFPAGNWSDAPTRNAYIMAALLHGGLVSSALGYSGWAAIACAAAVWLLIASSPEIAGSLKNRSAQSFASAIFCLVIVVSARMLHGGGGSDSPIELPPAKFVDLADPATAEPAEETPGAPKDSFPGVILYPEKQESVVLVPPRPVKPMLRSNGRPAEPYEIPFFGVYWFLRGASKTPPSRSVTKRGIPSKIRFATYDRAPLRMEARQNLGRHFDPGCCRSIRIDLRNADFLPMTVSAELILADTARPGLPARSLGRVMITKTPNMADVAKPTLTTESLSFAIPPGAETFDEIRVVFHMDRVRADRSARISIDRFLLLP